MPESTEISPGARGAGEQPRPPLPSPLTSAAVSAVFLTPGSPDLYPVMKRLRDEAPVFFSDELNMWIVSRYDDVARILKDPRRFPAATRSFILASYPPEVREILAATSTFSAPNMGFDDQPVHDRLRRPLTQYFSFRGVARLEERIRAIADRHLDGMPDRPPADLVESYARPLANSVIIELAGFPAGDRDRVLRGHRALNDFFFGRPAPEVQLGYAKDIRAWEEYLAEVIDERRRGRPGDDLISLLTRKVSQGEADYTDEELISLFSFDIITAGIRPSSFALINMCDELLRDRRRWEGLLAEPGRFDALFDETLRRSGLATGVFRATAADVAIEGVRIPAGSAVWALTASANRDERHFAAPDSFDPHRPQLGTSLHFSHGLHYCLGVNLARTVTRAGLAALMRRHPGMRRVMERTPVYEQGINVIAPARFTVEW
ncbi:cytochrome P450 [Streptomyces abikoensis]|uniref:cytochrome P450 n=1 Tax=Streptomyces abikoensis TaxID=97398 RepID=UPI00371D3F46